MLCLYSIIYFSFLLDDFNSRIRQDDSWFDVWWICYRILIGYITHKKKKKKILIGYIGYKRTIFVWEPLRIKFILRARMHLCSLCWVLKGRRGFVIGIWDSFVIFMIGNWSCRTLMDLLYSKFTFVGATYCMRWVLNGNGKFSLHSYYECLWGASRQPNSHGRVFWVGKCLTKCLFNCHDIWLSTSSSFLVTIQSFSLRLWLWIKLSTVYYL